MHSDFYKQRTLLTLFFMPKKNNLNAKISVITPVCFSLCQIVYVQGHQTVFLL